MTELELAVSRHRNLGACSELRRANNREERHASEDGGSVEAICEVRASSSLLHGAEVAFGQHERVSTLGHKPSQLTQAVDSRATMGHN